MCVGSLASTGKAAATTTTNDNRLTHQGMMNDRAVVKAIVSRNRKTFIAKVIFEFGLMMVCMLVGVGWRGTNSNST